MRTAQFLIVCADPALGIGSVPVASADENPAAVPREEITPSPAKASAPTACRRPFLLSAATPEERERLTEERKRLSAAAKSGTDRTAVVGFYQLACTRISPIPNSLGTTRPGAPPVPATPPTPGTLG